MKVNDTLANTTRAAHDVGLAAWLGGAMFAKFAMNPALSKISDHAERGSVSKAAWGSYNVVNAAALGTAAAGWAAARLTEAENNELTGFEQTLAQAKDALMISAVVTGVASGIQGILAKQAPDGDVPIEDGTTPALETPEPASGIQRSLGVLGNLNIASGVALVAVNGVLAQSNYSHPANRRALSRSTSTPSPAWLLSAGAAAAAALDEARRRRSL